MAKGITIYVVGRARRLTLQERETIAASGKNSIVWPIEVPVYDKGPKAAKLRNRNRWDAVRAAEDVVDSVAAARAKGQTVTIIVGPGVILTGQNTGDKDTSVWANTPAPWLLREIAQASNVTVDIAAGSEDPRDYDGWEPNAS